MKSIDKLREAATYNPSFSDNATRIVCNYLSNIEADIANNYMLLPVDADGVPIHVGDEIEFRNGDTYERGIVQCLSDCWVNFGGHSYYGVTNCRHVKPRTLEDIVADAIQYGHNGITGDRIEGKVAEFCAEIRELLGDDAE